MAAPRTTQMSQILSFLAGADGGTKSSAEIQRGTGIGTSSLFPALAALEYDALIASDWEDRPPPRRRLYSLTKAGRDQVGAMPALASTASTGTGNWFWRKFVQPFLGG